MTHGVDAGVPRRVSAFSVIRDPVVACDDRDDNRAETHPDDIANGPSGDCDDPIGGGQDDDDNDGDVPCFRYGTICRHGASLGATLHNYDDRSLWDDSGVRKDAGHDHYDDDEDDDRDRIDETDYDDVSCGEANAAGCENAVVNGVNRRYTNVKRWSSRPHTNPPHPAKEEVGSVPLLRHHIHSRYRSRRRRHHHHPRTDRNDYRLPARTTVCTNTWK